MEFVHDVRDADLETLLGLEFATDSVSAACERILSLSKREGCSVDVHFLNAFCISLTQGDDSYRTCLGRAGLLYADGRPVSFLSGLCLGNVQHVRGPALFERVMDEGRQLGVRHYLLGASTSTLQSLKTALETKYPGVRIVGSYSPPFRPMTEQETASQDASIKAARPDIVWVGLGTPKQDYEAQRIASSLGVLAAAVGAAFDFSAGNKKVAPPWVRRLGFEWLHRLVSEPRRLWKRYLIGNSVFLLAATKFFLSNLVRKHFA